MSEDERRTPHHPDAAHRTPHDSDAPAMGEDGLPTPRDPNAAAMGEGELGGHGDPGAAAVSDREFRAHRDLDAVAASVERASELTEIVGGCGWLVDLLEVVRDSGLPDAWIGAGAVRDLVWGSRFGPGFRPDQVRDVDVAFFDPDDLSRQRDQAATDLLLSARPDIPWEATNQAAVHTWYHKTFRTDPVPPLTSAADGIATWPEMATSVAVRLTLDGRLVICAPHGLDDLLDGIWRRNPRRASVQDSRARLARKDPARRWPGVRVIAS